MGFLDGIKNYFGTQAGAITPAATTSLAGNDSLVGPLMHAPTQAAPTSFLDRLGAPSPDGVSFRDRLFAVGAGLQGDTSGAASYLQNARNNAERLADKAKLQNDQARKAAAFKAAWVGGKFDAGVYAQMAGDALDASDVASFDRAFNPTGSFQSAGGGGLYYTNPSDHTATQVVAPPPRKVTAFNDDGTMNDEWIKQRALEAELVAHGRRVGAPPVGRSGGGATTGRPAGY